MATLESIERLAVYYQEFHHKCVTWYVTIMGFFVAGAITATAPSDPVKSRVIGVVLLVTAVLFAGFFIRCLAHYGARIKLLTIYLEGAVTSIPDDWRYSHKNVGWEVHGTGMHFFFSIVIAMQVVHLFLVLFRFF